MMSVSGVRGIYNDGLTDEIAEKFAFIFGQQYRSPVVVGRDSRKSGQQLAGAVIRGLRKAGSDVIDIGLATTPTTEMAVAARNASGGIIITASHNPAQWNGLKFLGSDGVFISGEEGEKLFRQYETVGNLGNVPFAASVSAWEGARDYHIRAVLALERIDADRIAGKKYTVCLDTVNGAGGPVCLDLLDSLGCEVHTLNCEPTGEFAHGAEPVPEHLGDLCSLVRDTGADIGFALDPDGDRLSIVNECGEAIGEEYTLALALDYLLEDGDGITVCNLSTSRMIDDIAARHGARVYRSPVGEINVVLQMREVGAKSGGEGNGGIIYQPLHEGRDGVLGIALILQMMTMNDRNIGELADSIPKYSMIKEKIDIARKGSWIEPVTSAFTGETMDTRDGIKVIFVDSWIHVRESNTEPIVRIMAEAPTTDAARMLVQRVYDALA